PRILPSYQVVLWKQESFVVLCALRIEFFRILLVDAGQRRIFGFSILKKIRKRKCCVNECNRDFTPATPVFS
ncbi:MAG: hypothetical protein WB799_19040, partial [Candidatus Sulfotelmatobacter sp.]